MTQKRRKNLLDGPVLFGQPINFQSLYVSIFVVDPVDLCVCVRAQAEKIGKYVHKSFKSR
jgi:hypothetical protein